MKLVNKSQMRLQNTPATTPQQASTTRPVRRRFFANTRMQNGTTTPAMTSIQKNGAVAPVVICASTAAPMSVPGYAMVSTSQPTM